MGLEHGRNGVEALHQQSHLVIDGEIEGSHQALAAPLPQPGRGGLEQDLGYLLVLDGLKEAPKAGAGAVGLVIQPVVVGGDAAHRLPVPEGQEILGLADFKEGTSALIQKAPLFRQQGRHPIRVILINTPGES